MPALRITGAELALLIKAAQSSRYILDRNATNRTQCEALERAAENIIFNCQVIPTADAGAVAPLSPGETIEWCLEMLMIRDVDKFFTAVTNSLPLIQMGDIHREAFEMALRARSLAGVTIMVQHILHDILGPE